MATLPPDSELKKTYPNAKDAATRKIVFEHDRLVVQVAKLKKDLKDEAGDYLRRIDDQKTRVHDLEHEKIQLKREIEALKERMDLMSTVIVDFSIKDI